MLMLIVVALLTLFLQRRAKEDTGYWEASAKNIATAKSIALVSLILWTAILTAGRWIAYTTEV
jgi:hypothetical protein